MINNIKGKLPSKKKASDDEDLQEDEDSTRAGQDRTDPNSDLGDNTLATGIKKVDDDEEDEIRPKSLVEKLKAKFGAKKSSEDDDGPAARTKKKGLNPVILGVVGLGLAALYLYEDEPEVPVVATPPHVSKRKQVQKPPEATGATGTAAPVAGAPGEATAPATSEGPATSPVDPAATDPTVTEALPEEPVVTEPAPTEEPVITEAPPVEETPPTSTETPAEEPVVSAPSESADTVDGQVTPDESSMTDKILEDLEKQVKKDEPKEVKKEYVGPPDYEYKGRGLVYNCAGKHWACVDGPSYRTCEDNFSSVNFQKKKIECYPFNVYQSTKGCEAMQNRVVSSNAKTGFCKGN